MPPPVRRRVAETITSRQHSNGAARDHIENGLVSVLARRPMPLHFMPLFYYDNQQTTAASPPHSEPVRCPTSR